MAEATRVLGVDPGLERTGYGLVVFAGGEAAFLDCGVIRTRRGDAMPERLLEIARGLGEVLRRHAPSHAVIERVFVNRNPGTSLKLGEARGAAVAVLGMAGAEIHELTPEEVKRSVTGRGNAPKVLVGTMVRGILGMRDDFDPGADALDALACAMCFRLSQKVALAAGGGGPASVAPARAQPAGRP